MGGERGGERGELDQETRRVKGRQCKLQSQEPRQKGSRHVRESSIELACVGLCHALCVPEQQAGGEALFPVLVMWSVGSEQAGFGGV